MKDEIPFSSPSSGDLSMCSIPPSPSERGTPASSRGRGSCVLEPIVNTPDRVNEQHPETLARTELPCPSTGQDVVLFGESSVSVNTQKPVIITINHIHNHAPSENNLGPKKTSAAISQVAGTSNTSFDRTNMEIATVSGSNGTRSTADYNSETSQSHGSTAAISRGRLQTSESSPIEVLRQLPPVEHVIQGQRQPVSRPQNGAMSETTVSTIDEENPGEIADRTNLEEHSSSVYQESLTNRTFAEEGTQPKALYNGDTEDPLLTAVFAASGQEEQPGTSRSLEPSTTSNGRNKRKSNEAKTSSEKKTPKIKKLKREIFQGKDIGSPANVKRSTPEDFEAYANQEELKRRHHRSTKPHLLLQTAELEACQGNGERAREALQKAQDNFEKHSRPSADELLEHAERCKEKGFFLRAALFQLLSATKKKAEDRKFHFFMSQRIFDIGRLVVSILNEKTRQEMRGGIHSKDVAEFVVPFMFELYEKCYQGIGSKAKSKCHDLSWIAAANNGIGNHQEAIRCGEKGRLIMQRAYAGEDTRQRFQTYDRLLQCIGLGYEGLGKYKEALKMLKESLAAAERAIDYKGDSQQLSISIKQKHVLRLEESVGMNTDDEDELVAGDGDESNGADVK